MNTSPPKAEYLPIDKLRPFEGHPFQVKDDDEMDQLVFSILTQGLDDVGRKNKYSLNAVLHSKDHFLNVLLILLKTYVIANHCRAVKLTPNVVDSYADAYVIGEVIESDEGVVLC